MRHLILLACLLAGCSSYGPYIGIGGGVRRVNGESGLVTCLGAGQQFSKRTSLEWEHCSDITKGSPFNSEYDVSHDTLTIRHRWGGKPK